MCSDYITFGVHCHLAICLFLITVISLLFFEGLCLHKAFCASLAALYWVTYRSVSSALCSQLQYSFHGSTISFPTAAGKDLANSHLSDLFFGNAIPEVPASHLAEAQHISKHINGICKFFVFYEECFSQ